MLAVGVDNMFILAHALQQQDPKLPIPERLGRALAGAGPSITLAAACEALAFGLGGLTSMPAVRNFSLCAAVAVLLDYALQVASLPQYSIRLKLVYAEFALSAECALCAAMTVLLKSGLQLIHCCDSLFPSEMYLSTLSSSARRQACHNISCDKATSSQLL